MNRSTCTSELSMKNMFSEKIYIHVSLGSIVNTQACCVNIFACEHLAQIILRPLQVLSLDEVATRSRRPIYFSAHEQNLQITPCFSFFHKSYFLCLSSLLRNYTNCELHNTNRKQFKQIQVVLYIDRFIGYKCHCCHKTQCWNIGSATTYQT